MSKFDVSDFDANELNQAIDDTNFPHGHNHNNNGNNSTHEDALLSSSRSKASSMPLPVVKQNGVFSKSFSDDVFDVPGTPKTPRSIPTPGNHCE
jgi:hypothetical protein